MEGIVPPGVKVVRRKLADGTAKAYYYHRATGEPILAEPGTQAFSIALSRLNGDVVEDLAWLVEQYQASREWQKNADSTKDRERPTFNDIITRFGWVPVRALTADRFRDDVEAWHQEMAVKHPRAADARIVRLSAIMSFAVKRRHIPFHPLQGLERAYHADRAENLWMPHHLARLQAAAPPEVYRVAFVALHTGQRRGDVLRLTWGQYDGQGIVLVPSKTRRAGKAPRRVYVPCTKPLKALLDSLPRDAVQILTSQRGRPWTDGGFDSAWDRAFAKSGINADLHFNDLRGTAITTLAEAGCGIPEIAAITGHSHDTVHRVLEHYLARTKPLAQSAISKLDAFLERRNSQSRSG